MTVTHRKVCRHHHHRSYHHRHHERCRITSLGIRLQNWRTMSLRFVNFMDVVELRRSGFVLP